MSCLHEANHGWVCWSGREATTWELLQVLPLRKESCRNSLHGCKGNRRGLWLHLWCNLPTLSSLIAQLILILLNSHATVPLSLKMPRPAITAKRRSQREQCVKLASTWCLLSLPSLLLLQESRHTTSRRLNEIDFLFLLLTVPWSLLEAEAEGGPVKQGCASRCFECLHCVRPDHRRVYRQYEWLAVSPGMYHMLRLW